MDTDGPWDTAKAQLVSALVVVGAIVTLLALTARTAPKSPVHQVPRFGYGSPPPPPERSVAPGPPIGPSSGEGTWLLDLIVQLLVAAVVVSAVGLVAAAVVVIVRRAGGQDATTEPDESRGESGASIDIVAVGAQLARSSAELEFTGDVNAAIVRCWQGLERLAEGAGVTRGPALTAREFTRLTLSRTMMPSDAVDMLADLYQAALFSGARLPEHARTDAVRCLERLQEATLTGAPR